MKKAVALILFLLIPYLAASEIEVTTFSFDPEQPQPGEPVAISVRLANKGYKEDVQVTCRLFINGRLHDVKVVPITRRSSSGVSFGWTAEPGEHFFSLEMSYYKDHAEISETYQQSLTVAGAVEQVDFFAEAMDLYQRQSYIQAKIMFEQAKRVFEEEQNSEQAVICEEYILKCDQYIEAAQLYQQGEKAYAQDDLDSAIRYYQQAKSLYELLEDEKASTCSQKIQEITAEQREKAERPYYLLLLLPVIAALVAFFWLRRTNPPPDLPKYEPERQEKRLFRLEDEPPPPELAKRLQRIESRLESAGPQDFKSIVKEFRNQEKTFDEEKRKQGYTSQQTHYIKKNMEALKDKIRRKGEELQHIQKLKELSEKCGSLLEQPVDDLVEAYNRYAQLHNAFDQIPDIGVPEQEDVKAKLQEYYQIIQEKARSSRSEK